MNKHLVHFLNDENNYKDLSTSKINSDKLFDKNLDQMLSREIILTESIDDNALEYLINSLPYYYTNLDVSNLSDDRIGILIKGNTLRFGVDSFKILLNSGSDKYIDLIESDFDSYFEKKDELQLPVGATTKLIQSNFIKLEDKEKIIKDIHEQSKYDLFNDESGLVEAIIDICLNDSLHLPFTVLENLFVYEDDRVKKVKLLIKNALNLSSQEIYSLLSKLGEPYSKITRSGYSVSLLKSDLHIELADALERVNYISSKKVKLTKVQIYLKR